MSNFENNCFYLENNEPKMNEYVEKTDEKNHGILIFLLNRCWILSTKLGDNLLLLWKTTLRYQK